MNYECELVEGKHLELSNEGDKTFASFSSRDTGQRQSQGHGFTTGQWVKTPAVFRVGKDVVIRIETNEGSRFLRVQGIQTTFLESEPALENAEKIELKESEKSDGWTPMKPMEPMEPMKPMKPMRPMN
jgi:hypothetical protein